MRSFRVYNRVRKVGVTFKLGGVEIGIASMTALFVILATVVVVAGMVSFVAGPAAVSTVAVLGAVAVLVTFFVVTRLSGMSKLREGTQLRLIRDTMRERRYKNFSTPDTAGDINDQSDPFAESESVYRNY